MRVLITVQDRGGRPVPGAVVDVQFGLTPRGETDERGNYYTIVASIITPYTYRIRATISKPNYHPLTFSDIHNDVESHYTVAIAPAQTQDPGELLEIRSDTPEIYGDLAFELDNTIIRQDEVLNVPDYPLIRFSNCATCLYFVPFRDKCVINGSQGPVLDVAAPWTMICRKVWPAAIPPAPPRLKRDALWNIPETSARTMLIGG